MKKLMFAVIGALALSSAVGADGPLTVYTHTKANAPSKAEYVRDENVKEVATKISTEIVREYSASNAVNGADHPLPAYLHYLKFDDVYADDAQRYYDMIDQGGLGASILKKGKKNRSNIGMFRSPVGLCSVRRMDNIVERDYDWHFNDTPSFVVEVSGIANVRYASIGVAEIGTNLTEEIIASQKGNWYYKCLPGSMLDGINEKGVMAELNVVPANGAEWETKGSRDINGHGGIRWILDNAASAGFAASNIAERAYIPKALKDLGFSLHYMICDKDETWIVEDGVAHLCQETTPVMTNYRLYMNDGEEDLYGSGYARAEILRDRSNPITDVWYTKGFAKTVDGIAWPDELAGVEVDGRKLTKNDTDELQNFAREKLWNILPPTRNAINPVTGENLWWQTIHCAKYDLTRKSFQIAVQENPDWYTFALSSTSTDEGEVRKLANEEIDKRDFQSQIGNAESNANAYADRIKESLVNNEIKAVGDRVSTNENKLTGLTKDTVVEEITDKVNSLKNGDVKANTDRISALETEAGKNTSRLEGIGESETVKNLIDGVEQKVRKIFKIKGSKTSADELPAASTAEEGDLWFMENTDETGKNVFYVLSIPDGGEKTWVKMGVTINMSAYKTGDEVDAALLLKRDTVDNAAYRPKNRIWVWEAVDRILAAADYAEQANNTYQLEPEYHTASGKWSVGDICDWHGVPKYASVVHEGTEIEDPNSTNVEFSVFALDEFGVPVGTSFRVRAKRDPDIADTTPIKLTGLETEVATKDYLRFKVSFKTLVDYYNKAIDEVKKLLGPAHVDNKEVTLGGGATNVNHLEAVTINGSARYPSYTYGFSNINIGLDNITGYGDDGVGGVINSKGVIESGKAYYDVVIGTSSSAKYMHSYVFGSQAHASAPNSLITGYGATVTDSDSVIIGFGFRPQADKKFNTRAEMLTWFRSFTSKTAATNAIPFVDYMISITNDTVLARNPVSYNGDYYVKSIRSAKDATYGWVELYQDAPHDERDEYIRGRHNWNYGKSHGKGTVNLVAKGSTGKDPGLSAVYINDRSLSELTGIRNGEPVYKPMYNKGIWTDPVLSPADMTIAIGDNAHATETNKSCQSIAIGRDSLSAGSATVVVGPNGFAEGAQAIAVGWRANAVGAHSISIGSAKKSGEDYYKDGDVNPNSDLQLAKGDYSVAIGYNNKSLAKDSISVGNGSKVAESAVGAVQLGAGENTEANTLKFQNVTIVKDGHVVGSTPDPKTEQVAPSGDVTVEPGSMTTLLPTEGATFPEEIGITCTGSRNFTMYIPNLPEIREASPWGIDTELPSGVSAAYYKDKKFVSKLPAKVTVEQPYSGLVVFKFEELESTFDWTPCVTNCAITYSEGKFVTEGSNSLLGESLHMCTNYKLVYTTDSNVVVTNDLMKLKNSGDAYITGTLYKGPSSVQYVCPAGQMPKLRDGEIIDFEVIYETVNGRAYFKNADGTKSDKIVKSINIAE